MCATTQDERQSEPKLQAQKIDGNWTVVHVEIGGKKLPDKAFAGVSIKEGTLHCTHDGKARSWKLEFGPKNSLKATEKGEAKVLNTGKDRPALPQMYVGVYLASSEYLCFALNPWTTDMKQPIDIGEGSSEEQAAGPQADKALLRDAVKYGPVGSDFILILRRDADANPKG
jgi:hypothetical protein